MEELLYSTTGATPWIVCVGIFVVLVLCGVGLPVPEEGVLLAAGYLASSGTIDRYPALAICVAGVLAGDFILFTLGRRWSSTRAASRILQRSLSPRRRVRVRRYFRRHGDKTILTARFVSGFRVAAFLTAGMAKMKSRTFLAFDLLGALVSVPLFFALGYFVHDHGDAIVDTIVRFNRGLVLLGALALAAIFLDRRRRRRRRDE